MAEWTIKLTGVDLDRLEAIAAERNAREPDALGADGHQPNLVVLAIGIGLAVLARREGIGARAGVRLVEVPAASGGRELWLEPADAEEREEVIPAPVSVCLAHGAIRAEVFDGARSTLVDVLEQLEELEATAAGGGR